MALTRKKSMRGGGFKKGGRDKPEPRRKPLSRNTKIRPRNPKRRQSKFARCYGSKARVEWVKQQRCLIAGRLFAACDGTIDNAHVITGGVGRKADYDMIVPMCQRHHREMHGDGQISFAARYSIPSLIAAAALTEQAWQSHLNGERT